MLTQLLVSAALPMLFCTATYGSRISSKICCITHLFCQSLLILFVRSGLHPLLNAPWLLDLDWSDVLQQQVGCNKLSGHVTAGGSDNLDLPIIGACFAYSIWS